MKKYAWHIFMLPFFLMASIGMAAQKTIIKTGDNIRIEEPIQGNTYLAAGEVFIDSVISGDLVGAVGTVYIQSSVWKDIFLAGGTIYLNAEAGEDVRIMGGNITISRPIKGDLLIAGGEVLITDQATIGGDIIVAGGNVKVSGTVNGDLYIAGGEVQLTGKVLGNLSTHSGRLSIIGSVEGSSKVIAQDLLISGGASFGKEVRYWTKNGKVDFGTSLDSGVVATYDNNLRPGYANVDWEKGIKTGFKVFTVLRIVSGILLIGLLISLFGRFFAARAGLVRKYAGRSFARGMALLIALPILSGFAFATVIGIPLSIIGFSAFTIFALSAGAITAIVLAYEWARIKNWPLTGGKIFLLSLGIFVLLRLISFLPVLGWGVNFVLAAIALGHVFRQYAQNGNEPAPATIKENSDLV